MLNKLYSAADMYQLPHLSYPGDIKLLNVSVRVSDWHKTEEVRYHAIDGSFVSFYEFRWVEEPKHHIVSGMGGGWGLNIQNFLARDRKHAMQKWYQYLRLTAGGATVEEALEIVEADTYLKVGI